MGIKRKTKLNEKIQNKHTLLTFEAVKDNFAVQLYGPLVLLPNSPASTPPCPGNHHESNGFHRTLEKPIYALRV